MPAGVLYMSVLCCFKKYQVFMSINSQVLTVQMFSCGQTLPNPGKGYEKISCSADTDCTGMLSVFLNCTSLHQELSEDMSQDTNIFQQVKQIRNTIMHSSSLTVKDDDLQRLIQLCCQILTDNKSLKHNARAKHAEQKIRVIESVPLTLSCVDYAALFEQVARELQRDMTDIKDTLSQTNTDLKDTQADVQENQTNITAVKTDIEKLQEDLVSGQHNQEQKLSELEEKVKNYTAALEELEALKKQFSTVETPEKKERKLTAEEVELKNYLLKQYQRKISKVKLSRWCEALNVLDMFAPLIIREDLERWLSSDILRKRDPNFDKVQASKQKPLQSYRDIFYKDDILLKEIYLLGEAGIGKSTFCLQLVNLWCKLQDSKPKTEYEKVLHSQDFVFYVCCRNAEKSQSVFDMIMKQLCPKKYLRIVENLFISQPEKCLVVIDGLDEWASPGTEDSGSICPDGLPDSKDVEGCIVLTTSRPWRIEALAQNLTDSCRVLEIQGLDPEGVESLTTDILAALGVQLAFIAQKNFKKQIEEREMTDIVRSPLMLVIIVMAWHAGNQTLDASMCRNYASLLESVLSHSYKKLQQNDIEMIYTRTKLGQISCFTEKTLCLKYGWLVEKLAELAFNSLFCKTKENSLVFDKKGLADLLGEEDLQFCLDLGLLSESKALSESNLCKVSVSFLHKSMQEFLAAVHFSTDNTDLCFNKFCQTVNNFPAIFDTKLVILFLCGMAPKKAHSVCGYISDLAEKSPVLIKYRNISERYHLPDGVAIENNVQQLQTFLLQCNTETDLLNEATRVRQDSPSTTKAEKSNKTKRQLHYKIADIVLYLAPADIRQTLCKQGKAIKSVVFHHQNKGPVDLMELVSEMTNIEKLCINTNGSDKKLSQYVDFTNNPITKLLHLKTFCLDLNNAGIIPLKPFGEMENLQSLQFGHLNLSALEGEHFPPQLQSLFFEWMSLSACLVSVLPDSLTSLMIQDVELSQPALSQFCKFFGSSSLLKSLTFHPRFRATISESIDLSLHTELLMLDLYGLVLRNGLLVSPLSPLKTLQLGAVYMSAGHWKCFTRSLFQSHRHLRKARFDWVDIDDESLSEISENTEVVWNTTDMLGRSVHFLNKKSQ